MFGSVILIDFTNEELDIIEDGLAWLLDQTNEEQDGKWLRALSLRKRVTHELGKRMFEAGLVKRIDKDTFIVGELK